MLSVMPSMMAGKKFGSTESLWDIQSRWENHFPSKSTSLTPLVFGRLRAMGRWWILGDMKIRLLLQAVPRNTTVVSDRL